ncbi:MAG: Fic family protein [Chloroflexota bacterium]|nr:Fic family protein [Chloroflexota bacterium]
MLYIADTLRHDPNTPVTEQLLATIHRLTTENIAYENNTPGSYRSRGVSAGSYVPPRDHSSIRRLMAEFIRWLNNGAVASWPPAVRAVAAHFYFISIHPFGDGNGRTARALESFLLHQGRINALGFYSLSNFYYRRREEYVAMLDDTRFKFGRDLTPFVCFALNGLVEELEAVHGEVLEEITWIAFNDYVREQLARSGRLRTKAGDRLLWLLTHLREPMTVRELRSGASAASHLYAGLSSKTLSRDLEYLRTEGLIVISDGTIWADLALMREFMP